MWSAEIKFAKPAHTSGVAGLETRQDAEDWVRQELRCRGRRDLFNHYRFDCEGKAVPAQIRIFKGAETNRVTYIRDC